MHRSTDEWARDAVDAFRGLVRAREAALVIADDGWRRVAGDARTARIAERLAMATDRSTSRQAAAQIGRSADLDDSGAPDATMPHTRYDVAWGVVPIGGPGACIAVCCAFSAPVSRRTARTRAAALESAWPALELAAYAQLGRRCRDEVQHRLLHALPVAAARCARDGALAYVNPALARLLADDGEGAALCEAIARAGAAAHPGAPPAAEEVTVLRTVRHRYRVRIRRLAGAMADDGERLVLVEPAAVITPSSDPGSGAERLRQRYRLTQREYDVARLIHLGHSNQAIATALGISPHTARHYTERVLVKLGIASRAAIHDLMLDDELGCGMQPNADQDGTVPPADVPLRSELRRSDRRAAHAGRTEAPAIDPPAQAGCAAAQ